MIHTAHLITTAAYIVAGAILFACGLSAKFRWTLLRNERDRSAAFILVGVFVYSCALDHGADALKAPADALVLTAWFEAAVSAFTALFLTLKAAFQWRR